MERIIARRAWLLGQLALHYQSGHQVAFLETNAEDADSCITEDRESEDDSETTSSSVPDLCTHVVESSSADRLPETKEIVDENLVSF